MERIHLAILLLVLTWLAGVVAYEYLEGWNWVDAIYFTSATMTTVGYGDVHPATDAGKLFTAGFIWVSVSIGFYVIFTITAIRENIQQTILDTIRVRREKRRKH